MLIVARLVRRPAAVRFSCWTSTEVGRAKTEEVVRRRVKIVLRRSILAVCGLRNLGVLKAGVGWEKICLGLLTLRI